MFKNKRWGDSFRKGVYKLTFGTVKISQFTLTVKKIIPLNICQEEKLMVS